ncbi:unnamed protein product [Absidia cylindrospora]
MANKKQAFSVRLNRDAYNMILLQPRAMRIEIGDSSSVMVIGERPFELNLRRELSTVQVYKKIQQTSMDDDNRIRYVGDVTHTVHMKQILSEDDKKRARSRTEQVEKEKNAKRIELLDVPSIPTPTKMYGNTNTTPTAPLKASPTKRNNLLSPSTKNHSSSPSSKYISSTKITSSSSPAPQGGYGITDNGGTSRLEGAALANLRERLIHLLALDPRPTDQLIQMLKVAAVDLSPLLKKVAVFTNSAWCLRPEVFKEIRIWEWTRYDDKERASVRKKAEDAYDFLKLPRNAPERANLLQRKPRRPSPKLIPPPSQHTPILGSNSNINTATKNDPTTPNSIPHTNHSSSTSSSSSSSSSHIKTTNNNDTTNTNPKRGRVDTEDPSNLKLTAMKKRKSEKPTKPKSSSSLESVIGTTVNSAIPPSSKQHPSSPAYSAPTKKRRTEIKKQRIPAVHQLNVIESTTRHDNDVVSSTDLDDDDNNNDDINEGEENEREHGSHHRGIKSYVAPTIHTQMDFDLLCKEHQKTQQYYIRFKKTFVQNHPIYVQALAAVNEQDKKMFERKLKAYYKSKGGDMNKWRLLMQLSRRFNGIHAKINIMWDTIEKAYRQKKFSLRLNRKSSSSSSSSSASSSPPLPRPRPVSSKSIKKSSSHR